MCFVLLDVGKDIPLTNHVARQLEEFSIKIIYNDTKSKSLAECRAEKWTKLKKSTREIPPDQESHYIRSCRVNYQSYIFCHYNKSDAPPSPLNHGWYMQDGKCYPLRNATPALPSNVIHLVEQ